ncbi:serine/threonine-protein kinase, partial [Amycolatopsis sp. SID8362]|uniref:serine/threonine-protein kinase n=1 Tax=Amycolatopsis sp. SID8362 TaxID=2690346 RepID=UPI00136DC919
MDDTWRVPGYAEVDVLGSGGFGRVVLAKHEASGRLVAIKYLRAEFLADARIADGFRREAWLLSGVRSPHVVRLFDFTETPRGAALIMEAVPGVSLRALLAAENLLAPEAALAILKGSLLGLADAHAVGVVHRDYKPGNVLVSREGESKLVDFGLATLDGHNGLTAGSPAYMAPEQWAGQPGLPATDVYAATCVFYQCVTGHRPFEADTSEQLRALHGGAPVPLEAVPEPLRPLIARGMAKDPAWRPATAAAFVTELETVAREAYGKNWEKRGWKRLATSAAALTALTPLALLTGAGTAAAPVAAAGA